MNRFALTSRLLVGLLPLLTVLPLAAQAPTLTATLTRTVTGDFTYVGSMVIGADGSVLVSQPSDVRLLLVTAAPEPKVLGRRGAGPNEFQFIQGLGLAGGKFWAYDAQLQRITFIEPTGAFGPSQPLEGLAGKPALRGFMSPSLVAVVTPDSLLVAASAEGTGMLGMIELAERHFMITGAGQLAMREVARRAAAPNCAVIQGNGVSAARTTAIATALDAAETKRGAARATALRALAGTVDKDVAGATDKARVKSLAAEMRRLAAAK
ncbi:MAG: hypothetical protein IPO52_13695 [Gemmatimonadetes bacterium]|jgi:hypothetical protein|nr:hypothetical protein [Gemmatimonadota bacterium]MBP6443220.1 hypothetical protein [Gemmatimonadales bacterium]MBK7594926.1 hypothetical protein [Gemmatimonadota bacterium]MBK9550118.1 hypothetical protein [Gemmatimonadota bacterium]MBP7619620.1 hypothetical protein [Gemmatimonadales bacterium]